MNNLIRFRDLNTRDLFKCPCCNEIFTKVSVRSYRHGAETITITNIEADLWFVIRLRAPGTETKCL